MRKVILIQARLSSSRFPKKMLHQLNGISLIEYVYNRCKQSNRADDVVVITSIEKSDDELFELCKSKNIAVYRGDLNNVLKRYIGASEFFDVDVICRVCGDSPFVDIEAIDKMFLQFNDVATLDYMQTKNTLNGFMSEVFTLNLLKKIYNADLSVEDKEHVTKYLRDNMSNFNTKELILDLRPEELAKFTLTIDYLDDIFIAEKIIRHLINYEFKSNDIIEILKKLERVK